MVWHHGVQNAYRNHSAYKQKLWAEIQHEFILPYRAGDACRY